MQDIIALQPRTQIHSSGSYIVSYPHFLSYFSELDVIALPDLVRGAHMVYGWMPTILDLYQEAPESGYDNVIAILNRAKQGHLLSFEEVKITASAINNSVVGASKLLHFINPSTFAIWDSKVYAFVHEQKPHGYRVNDAKNYLNYLALLRQNVKRDGFIEFHADVNRKLGYDVSAFRAIELIMFLNSPLIDLRLNDGQWPKAVA